ncbi:MAG: zinc-binding dehydrogenase [bacterium]
MKAVQLINAGTELEDREIAKPIPSNYEVLVKIKAAGICHSDVHYRNGVVPLPSLPRTLGHEIAGVVDSAGPAVTNFRKGDRVCVHYHDFCGECSYCISGNEQFCAKAQMIGKHRDGGYAEYCTVPARSLIHLPDEIPFDHGAVMMCSTATSFHALQKARLQSGESVAVFGCGGLGLSAIQLARALGAGQVYGIDIQQQKLIAAERFGALPINPNEGNPVSRIRELTKNRGVDVALELIGSSMTMQQAVRSLAPMGRAVLVGLSLQNLELNPYTEILGKEAEVIGCSDHLLSELPIVLEFARSGKLDLTQIVTRSIPLSASSINTVFAELSRWESSIRTVIKP